METHPTFAVCLSSYVTGKSDWVNTVAIQNLHNKHLSSNLSSLINNLLYWLKQAGARSGWIPGKDTCLEYTCGTTGSRGDSIGCLCRHFELIWSQTEAPRWQLRLTARVFGHFIRSTVPTGSFSRLLIRGSNRPIRRQQPHDDHPWLWTRGCTVQMVESESGISNVEACGSDSGCCHGCLQHMQSNKKILF